MFWQKKIPSIEDEINSIKDIQVQSFVKEATWYIPDYWWFVESSKSHHPKDERKKYGRLLHAKKMVKLVNKLRPAQLFTELTYDLLVAAAILHDMCVRGKYLQESDKALPHHSILVREVLSDLIDKYKEFGWTDELFGIIDTHMGIWGCYDREGEVPASTPRTLTEFSFHVLDMIASRDFVNIDVKEKR